MVESAATPLGPDVETSERPEPPTTLLVSRPETASRLDAGQEPPTRPMTQAAEASRDTLTSIERAEPVWPGLTAAGLPTRVPRQAAESDEEAVKEAFAQSWESTPTSPTPLTRKPFTPTYLTEPPRPRTSLADLDPGVLLGTAPADTTTGQAAADSADANPATSDSPSRSPASDAPSGAAASSITQPESGPGAAPVGPPDPKEPPDPAEPPEPRQPPEPKEPPQPPAPPAPSPFPSPAPVPTPPEPMPPSPVPSPIPPSPPPGPVPTPPPPFPPPPGPVPPPPTMATPDRATTPVIVPGSSTPTPTRATPPTKTPAPAKTPAPRPRPAIGTSTYQGGAYTELSTEPITGIAVSGGPAVPESVEMSGSLSGHLLSRNHHLYRRRERRRKLKVALWVIVTLALFTVGIAVVVNLLAGDFLRSIFDTFSGWAG